MKKIILIVVLIVSLTSCRYNLSDRGTIYDKGIDKVNVKAMMDGLSIESTEKDKNSIDMYWVKLHKSDEKIYVNLFTYEDYDIGDYIVLGPEAADIRFQKEW